MSLNTTISRPSAKPMVSSNSSSLDEARMLAIACFAMLGLSLVSALGLWYFGAGPLWTIFGGTFVGIAAYAIICVRSKLHITHVPKDLVENDPA